LKELVISFGFDELNQFGLFYYCFTLDNKVSFGWRFWKVDFEKIIVKVPLMSYQNNQFQVNFVWLSIFLQC